jgi:hypothetical protein
VPEERGKLSREENYCTGSGRIDLCRREILGKLKEGIL